MMKARPKIQDYAVVGDGRSAALVSRDGSIDWLCWPRFDSPPLFAAILDDRVGGSWSIRPVEPARIERRYVDKTNVLQMRFRTSSGTVTLTDFMLAIGEDEKRRMLVPEHELIRRVECERGEVEMAIHFDPRLDFGRRRPAIHDAGPLGLRMEVGSSLIGLVGDVHLRPCGDGAYSARVRLGAHESASFSLTHSVEGPAVVAPLGDLAFEKLFGAIDWWKAWARRMQYDGPFRDAVARSALTLKLMLYAPSGAVVAAPTTSLPERAGGDLNWDYRYCWLRDAAFTTRALFGLGYRDEADAFANWLLHATRLTRPELGVIYDVFGERNLNEIELPNLRGYSDSRPVRIGNAAHNQLQLDIYGEVIEAVTQFLPEHETPDRDTRTMLRQFGAYVCRHWREPDHGIWESRRVPQSYLHSKLMCWVALDRLLELAQSGRLDAIPVEQFSKHRDAIRREIEERGWNPRLDSFTQTLGGDSVDASALLLALYGFHEASSRRMQKTHQRIKERLGAGAALLYRKEESPARGEGAFAMCSFWEAEFLARGGGSIDDAYDALERAVALSNDVGLFAEEIDPATGDALGNFPQAYTHVGLINAALSLADRIECAPVQNEFFTRREEQLSGRLAG